MFYRGTWIEVNLDRFQHNIEILKEKTKKALFCVVKANAYGHGDVKIVKEAIAAGCRYIAVSSMDEAMHLRRHHAHVPILILGYVHPDHIKEACLNQLTLTAVSWEWVQEVCAKGPFPHLKIHIKADTGMNRLGMKNIEEIRASIALLRKAECDIEGIYTHYHSADNKDKTAAQRQQNWFCHIVKSLDTKFTWIHSANSDAALSLEEDGLCNAVRIGLALYGIPSVETLTDLRPVLSLYTTISHVKEVNKGESIGYGATYTCLQKEWIATLPIGYGDGWLRANQGRFVCIHAHPYEMVGRICMDQCMVKLDKPYPINTRVELIGEYCDLSLMARQLQTIPYEILCLLSDRIPRLYIKEGKVIDELDLRNH